MNTTLLVEIILFFIFPKIGPLLDWVTERVTDPVNSCGHDTRLVESLSQSVGTHYSTTQVFHVLTGLLVV